MQFDLPSAVIKTINKLQAVGFKAYVVGGAVRDLIQGKEVHDWDFTTDAAPEKIQKLFPGSFYDNKFGTVGIVVNRYDAGKSRHDEIYEITTFRTEFGYADRRRPDEVVWGKTLDEDLSRRDFTVNAMALQVTSYQLPETSQKGITEVEIIDPYGGKKDLENKIIRAVGDPNERFNEDALRMMRAIRIAAQLGFSIEPKTLSAIDSNHQLLRCVSLERIRDELMKIIGSDYPADGLMILHQTHLLEMVLPELTAAIGVKQAGHHIYDVFTHSIESLRHCPSSDPLVRLATLLHDIGKVPTDKIRKGKITFYGHEVVGARMAKAIAGRLRLPVEQKDKLWRLSRWHMFSYQPKMTDAAIRRFIRRVGKDDINDIILLRIGDRKGGGSKTTSWRLRELQERIGTLMYDPLEVTDLKVNGNDVMEILKIKPGPKVGQILNALFEEILEDPKKNERKYLLSYIESQGKQGAGGVENGDIIPAGVAARDE